MRIPEASKQKSEQILAIRQHSRLPRLSKKSHQRRWSRSTHSAKVQTSTVSCRHEVPKFMIRICHPRLRIKGLITHLIEGSQADSGFFLSALGFELGPTP
jgi:hypothetical protein